MIEAIVPTVYFVGIPMYMVIAGRVIKWRYLRRYKSSMVERKFRPGQDDWDVVIFGGIAWPVTVLMFAVLGLSGLVKPLIFGRDS